MKSLRLVASLIVFAAMISATAEARPPGSRPPGVPTASRAPVVPNALSDQFFSGTGLLFLSVDGSGSDVGTAPIRVQKPSATATVQKAFLLATTVPNGFVIPDGSITLNGTPIPAWSASIANSIGGNNYRADVTSIVKPVVDAAAVGITTFTVGEPSPGNTDGEILAVVFDDPAQLASKTVILLFGAQAVGGDTFSITLAQPIDPAAPGALADMGLGISFSFQNNGAQQFSQIDVNSQRLTTSAGGEDDGGDSGGALITVGGIGDTNANPADPNATPTNPRSDDELYSLLPFITSTTTSISVFTQNASRDDNIFFSYFNLSGAAIVGGGIVLGPATATNPTGTPHTVTATVVDVAGAPRLGVTVTFNVISGPNIGVTGQAVTNASGQASFTYTGNGGAGIDQINASFLQGSTTFTSNTVTKTWTASTAPPDLVVTKTASTSSPVVGVAFNYTIAVTNAGTGPATGVVVSDPLPGGLIFNGASSTVGTCALTAGVVNCSVGTLAAGAGATITISVIPSAPGAISNTAAATEAETDVTPANNASTIQLTVSTPPVVPTLSSWALIGLGLLLAGFSAALLKK
jgi:uncharacterized repeat protein (TIGR01451 family)